MVYNISENYVYYRIVIIDKSWFYYFDLENKIIVQLMEIILLKKSKIYKIFWKEYV